MGDAHYLSQSALPQVPGRRRAPGLARRAAGRPAAGALLPRRLHAAGADGRASPFRTRPRLRHPVQGRGRDAAHHRRRPQASRRRDRPRRGAAHLGPAPAPSSARPLHRARRRPVAYPSGSIGRAWIACRPGFFLPVRVLSRLFRRLFLRGAASRLCGRQSGLLRRPRRAVAPAAFARRLAELRRVEWVVYAKPPFGGPVQVLAYLGRYTHRVAIANSRLVSMTDGRVALPLEGLSPSRQGQGHDACRRRVHPPLPAAHPARRLPPHPPLRLSR